MGRAACDVVSAGVPEPERNGTRRSAEQKKNNRVEGAEARVLCGPGHPEPAPLLGRCERSECRCPLRSCPSRSWGARRLPASLSVCRLLLFVLERVEVAGQVGVLAGVEGFVGPLLLGDRQLADGADWFLPSLFPHGRTPFVGVLISRRGHGVFGFRNRIGELVCAIRAGGKLSATGLVRGCFQDEEETLFPSGAEKPHSRAGEEDHRRAQELQRGRGCRVPGVAATPTATGRSKAERAAG